MSNFTVGDDDLSVVQNPHQLVLGTMGIGTFLIFFFSVILAAVWYFSVACRIVEKTIARGVSLLLFTITMLVIVFAEREPKFSHSGYQNNVCSVMLLLSIRTQLYTKSPSTLFAIFL
jgi:hypothetical protein